MAGAANLAAAVASGADVTTVERLLAGNADISAVAGERRETALHFAARREPNLTSILLSAGASLDSTCTEGFTPLHAAAHAGAAQCLSILLAAPGVEACARTSRGDSALHLAAISGSGAVAALLLDAAPALLEFMLLTRAPESAPWSLVVKGPEAAKAAHTDLYERWASTMVPPYELVSDKLPGVASTMSLLALGAEESVDAVPSVSRRQMSVTSWQMPPDDEHK